MVSQINANSNGNVSNSRISFVDRKNPKQATDGSDDKADETNATDSSDTKNGQDVENANG